MDFNYLLFLIFFINCKESVYNHTNKENNLFFVFTTFRHGARFPETNIDYFGNVISSPGKLSKYGIIQNLEIGKKYRKRYSNFLNMEFDKNQIYIRTSDMERTIISTEKQLEGLFNKTIERKYFDIIKGGMDYFNLYHLDNKEHKKMDEYLKFCNKRKLSIDYIEIFQKDVFPILHHFYGISKTPSNLEDFCESAYAAYFEYIYDNDTNNKIGNCGIENISKINNFCYNWYNTFRGWNEYSAYMFYMLYHHIFEYMNKTVSGKSKLKIIMIAGHDITIDKFMNFLDGIKIIPRTYYPHYAFNIVLELRKYNNVFYIEIYYNDILKYNNTFKNFKNILTNSKYSNLYNYCGFPPERNFLKKLFKQKYFHIIRIIITSFFIFLIISIIFYYMKQKLDGHIKLNEDNNQNKNDINIITMNE